MGEETVIADRDPQTAQRPEDEEERQVERRDRVEEQQHDRAGGAEDRQHVEQEKVHSLHLVQVRTVDNLLARLPWQLHLLEHLMSDLIASVQHDSSSNRSPQVAGTDRRMTCAREVFIA